jgi:UDP-N-acetylmuramate dehydrogenase
MPNFDDLNGTVKLNEPLAPLVWFRLGGPARYFARPRQLDELIALLKRCREEGSAFDLGRWVERAGAR